MRKKFIGVLAAASFAFVGLATVPTLGDSVTPAISLVESKNITVYKDGRIIGTYHTFTENVEDFLKENEIHVKDGRIVIYQDMEKLTDGSTMYIDFPDKKEEIEDKIKEENGIITVKVFIDDKSFDYDTSNTKQVKDIVKELSLRDDTDYYYVDGDSTDSLYDEMEIRLLSRSEEIFTATENLPFEIEYVDTEEIAEGKEEVITEGIDGQVTTTTKVVFYGGEEYLRKVISQEVTVPAVNKVIKRGVAKSVQTPEGKLQYSNVITMNASAYTPGFESTGKNPGDPGYGRTATGRTATKGVVAVDPSVIPLGTKVYIEGYGVAIAADTGGAIKGNKIDLCYDTVDEALGFGRRNVKVYVLK